MEVTATIGSINSGITKNTSVTAEAESRPNAYGIGSANRPEVELSPQARILQKADENQRTLREQFDEQRDKAKERTEKQQEQQQGSDGFVRVSSSEGSAQKNNLSAEKAAEVYQAISRLL
ncbi:hypothetical protein KIH87_16760 [Paraneptunicella aestuarii]|uniref:hypothetical protein n=1 Tax=Paraneptunicella aestuarii TaxID=2831148 RepID=UPI001E55F624|nr:hypothetical protein [Paraneptunicella aestuarii]UAA38316.1 hypothetical protein KIH87_16760 [Paraneptunicella aestuarii]